MAYVFIVTCGGSEILPLLLISLINAAEPVNILYTSLRKHSDVLP